MRTYVDSMTGRGQFEVDTQKNRPNIILISADMIPFEFHGDVPGAPHVRTPYLDSLRDDGVRFSHTYATSPLCTPSRASYLTGRYSYITTNSERAHDGHEIHLRKDDTIFPEYLKASGYAVRHVGKSHVGTHAFMDVFGENDSPWNRWSPPWYDDEAYLSYLADRGLGAISFAEKITGLDPAGHGAGADFGGWIAAQNDAGFPKEGTYPFYLAHRAIQSLKHMGITRAPDRPFYLQLDFFAPHQPFAIPSGMEERRTELERTVELPNSYRELAKQGFPPRKDEPRVYALYRKNWGLTDPETVRKYIIANILQYELLDEAIGRLLEYLRRSGQYDNTWIFFLGDHGEMNGRSALVDKGAYLNPRVLRTPFVVKPSADFGHKAGSTVSTPTSLLDLAPTVLSIAGVSHNERADGMDLASVFTGIETPRLGDKPVLSEIWSHVMPNPAVSIVFLYDDGRQYMLTYNATDSSDELYDIDESSVELRNLIDDRFYEHVLDSGLQELERVLAQDERWRSYLNFIRLEYADRFPHVGGDRQHFGR